VQDEFAAKSFQKAATAQKAGKFKDEIVLIKTVIVNPKTEKEVEIVVDADDDIRDGVAAPNLSKLKPSSSKDGSTHAGRASQVSEGAAALLLARRSVAKKLVLPLVGKFVNSVVAGVPPCIMGVGPAFATPEVLNLVGLTKDEVDFYEINEAFASQAVFSIQHLKIPFEKVNINGGTIAIGHPLGCTGARQISTGLNVARQTGGRVFVNSMCIGSGMGMAAVFVSEH
jgi:acetyl-CoA acyltransferase 1